jgi:cold shock CspA family protein
MKTPIQITYRDVEPSSAIDKAIRTKAAALDGFYRGIMSCRVMVEAPHRRHQRGRHYHVRIDMKVPGAELVVARDPTQHGAYEDLYVAIRDAFHAARRELEDYARKRRGQVKVHDEPRRGFVVRLFADQGYGFLQAEDGHEVYFHENSVLDDFDRLQVGIKVRYAEEQGEKGPQASTVAIAGAQALPSTAR